MSAIQAVQNGKLVQPTDTTAEKKNGENSYLNKDSFLQLLVAEMKYQDPLEPTSNTEYIAQFATFSQVESLQNMESTIELQRAQDLVGKTVVLNVDDKYVTGVVDYVTYTNGKALLTINGQQYSMDYLEDVVNPDYLDAYNLATDVTKALQKLPALASVTTKNQEAIEQLQKTYSEMTDYQKGFLDPEDVASLKEYIAKLESLLEEASKNNNQNAGGTAVEEAKKENDTQVDMPEETEAAEEIVEAVDDKTENPENSEISDETLDALLGDSQETNSSSEVNGATESVSSEVVSESSSTAEESSDSEEEVDSSDESDEVDSTEES